MKQVTKISKAGSIGQRIFISTPEFVFSFYPSWGNQLVMGSENHAVGDFLLDHFKEMILRFISCENRLGQVPSSSSLFYVTYLSVSGEGEQVTLGYWRFVENLSGGCCA